MNQTRALASTNHRDIRRDLLLIAEMVTPGSRLLDVGCGDGTLLEYLMSEKQVDGRGIEIRQSGVNACVARGLSVIQAMPTATCRTIPMPPSTMWC